MELVNHLVKQGLSYKHCAKSKKYVLQEDGETLIKTYKSTEELCKSRLLDYWKVHDRDKCLEILETDHPKLYFYNLVVKELKEHNKQAEAKRLADRKALAGDLTIKIKDPGEMLKLYPLTGAGEPKLWDLKLNQIYNTEIKSYENTIKDLMGKDKRVIYFNSGLYESHYDPTPGSEVVSKVNVDGYTHLKLNLYKSPKWVTDYKDLRQDACIPEVVKKFLHNFFLGNEPTIDRVLDWFAASLFSRDPLMLCLVSEAQGTGKSLLSDLFGAMHAEDKYHKPPASVFEKEFNHSLYGKTLVMIEEIKASNGSAKENIKRLVGNTGITTRKMHTDQGSKLDHPISFICTTNKASDIGLDGQGRRFFIPNITSERIANFMELDEVNKLHRLKACFGKDGCEEDRQEMAKFAWFLYERFKTNGVKDVSELELIKPNNFWVCQRACMSAWQREVLDYFLEGQAEEDVLSPKGDALVLQLEHIREHLEEQNMRLLPSVQTIKNFISTHEWRGEIIARVEDRTPAKDSHVFPNINSKTLFNRSPFDEELDEDLL